MIAQLAVATALGAVAGAAVARPRHDTLIDLTPGPEPLWGPQRCPCGCVALRARQAHLEQLVAYWRREAGR